MIKNHVDCPRLLTLRLCKDYGLTNLMKLLWPYERGVWNKSRRMTL